MKTFHIRFDSESGDHFPIGTYWSESAPTKGQLDALARQEIASSIEDGTLYGRFDVTEIGVVEPLPDADPDAEPLGVI